MSAAEIPPLWILEYAVTSPLDFKNEFLEGVLSYCGMD